MDILDIIKEKVKSIPEENSLGIKAVILHIETAEKFLLRAKTENDENLFTDVIYRTNHAFEGILKEAYTTLANKDASRETPNNIEKYLSTHNVFKARVLDLFTNYRTQWRNPSTHDYQLFFTEEEAFLAIVNVSAFVNIFLDQIIEKIKFDLEKAEVDTREAEIKASLGNYESLSLEEKIKQLLVTFSKSLSLSETEDMRLREIELSGLLSGFIAALDPSIKLEHEPILGNNRNLRPDILVSRGDEKIIVELKGTTSVGRNIKMARDQILSYLVHSGINTGVIYFYIPQGSDVVVSEEAVGVNDQFKIIEIKPKVK
jgi:hypothetical protein